MDSAIRRLINTWVPSIITFIGITTLSIISVKPPGLLFNTSDLFKHFFAYLILSILLHFPVRRTFKYHKIFRAVIILIFCASYGFIMEGVQNFVPGRDTDLLDAIANSCGALTGQLMSYVMETIEDNKKRTG